MNDGINTSDLHQKHEPSKYAGDFQEKTPSNCNKVNQGLNM